MLKRLSLYTLLLCFVPFFVWIFAWQWHGKLEMTEFDHFLYFLTETGSVPYALITCGVLAVLFMPLFANKKQWVLAVMIMASAVLITQVFKTGLKTLFAEPRPYVSYMVTESQSNAEQFYAHQRDERAAIVEKFYQTQPTPSWLKGHYMDEVGYSFPSGHSIFAATWLFLLVGFAQLLGKNSFKVRLSIMAMSAWALLMLISRLRLGMHYPIDLLVSVLVAFVVHWGIFTFVQKKGFFTHDRA